ncbi:MAG: YbaB/EbfC family nucleoid-associated protein [Acidimicrobiia bacterium]|nr:YbaB/EbfC family nucleoid-associated protein [Acidimicrobiia bacterium]
MSGAPGPGMSGMPDMGGLLEQAMQMQQQLLDAQATAAATEVEGVAGGGVVRVTMTADLQVRRVQIDPELADPDELEMLQDLVVAAVNDAIGRADEVRAASMGGGLPDPGELLAGLGLGSSGGAPAGLDALLSGVPGIDDGSLIPEVDDIGDDEGQDDDRS